jgi:hypothetical protein
MLSEPTLRALLARVPELDLDSEKGTVKKLLSRPAEADKRAVAHPIRDVVASRVDLRGLPLRNDVDCLTGKAAALNLDRLSRDFRALDARRARERAARTRSRGRAAATSEHSSHALAERYYLEEGIDHDLVSALRSSKGWQEEKAVGPLMQMLQADSLPVRRYLVDTLAGTKGRSATEALARLAVFDLSPTVREDALAALQKRPVADARPVFVSALRYPWAPAADHAADALVALNDRKAVAALEPLLAQPDPSAPFVNGDGKLVVRELVRVNHLRNCLLCHAASGSNSDRVRGFVPKPGEAIPIVYYAARTGNFVRADVTYLKQDFSIALPVAEAAPWPDIQRYDFLLRTRELSGAERARWSAQAARAAIARRVPSSASYPQKEALLFALHHLKAKGPPEAPTE